MKKHLLFLLAALPALPASASDDVDFPYEGQTLSYRIDSTTATLLGPADRDNLSGDVVIPDEVIYEGKAYPVTAFSGGFENCTGLISVTFPESMTKFWDFTFKGCTGLTTVHIPEHHEPYYFPTSFPGCFEGCTSLTTLPILDDTHIPDRYAYGCTGLTSIDLPESISYIGENAFTGCTGLTSVTIPGKVKWLDPACFQNCSNLKTVIIADSEEKLSVYSKVDETETSMTFTGSPVEHLYIGRQCSQFFPINTVKTLEFGGGCTNVDFINQGGYYANVDWRSLTGITFGNSVTEIAEEAFEGEYTRYSQTYPAHSLSWIILPESLKKIGSKAFANCKKLFSVMILSSDCDIADDAFSGCSWLNKIAAPDKETALKIKQKPNSVWTISAGETVDVEKGIIWGANADTAPWVTGKYTGKLVIPEDVTSLYWICMAECPNITEVILPSKLETIGVQAFLNCTSLTELILPSKLETIGSQAFQNCTSLKDITIPNRITEMETDAFDGTELVKGAYPDMLSNPFKDGVEAISYDAYDSMTEDGFVYSRHKDRLYYAPLSVSSTFEVPESVVEITTHAFSQCAALESVILPAGLATLGDGVWNDCQSITSVTCKGPEPVSANRDLFPNTVYDEATLYVPKGSEAVYGNVVPWRYFNNIVGAGNENGVEEVISDNAAVDLNLPCEVYSLQGVKVADTTADLPAGIYIVRQGETVMKIAVK